jgi:hypothetical protein
MQKLEYDYTRRNGSHAGEEFAKMKERSEKGERREKKDFVSLIGLNETRGKHTMVFNANIPNPKGKLRGGDDEKLEQ